MNLQQQQNNQSQFSAQPSANTVMTGQQNSYMPQQAYNYSWARPVVEVPEKTQPLRYHQLFNGIMRPRWFKPLLINFVGGVYYFVASIIFVIIAVVALLPVLAETVDFDELLSGSLSETEIMQQIMDLAGNNPIFIAFTLLSVILMLPTMWLALKSFGVNVTGRVWSVAGKIRWRLLMTAIIAAITAYIVVQGAIIVISLSVYGTPAPGVQPAEIDFTNLIFGLLVVFLLVPFQATAEEYIFRGTLLQMFGSWVKMPVFAIALSTFLFAAMHIQYDIYGMMLVAMMGAVAGYLTVRTGGIEAAMAVHIINNIFAFSMQLLGFYGDNPEGAAAQVGPADFLVQALQLTIFALLIEIIWARGQKRARWVNKRIDWVYTRKQIDFAQPIAINNSNSAFVVAPTVQKHIEHPVQPVAAPPVNNVQHPSVSAVQQISHENAQPVFAAQTQLPQIAPGIVLKPEFMQQKQSQPTQASTFSADHGAEKQNASN